MEPFRQKGLLWHREAALFLRVYVCDLLQTLPAESKLSDPQYHIRTVHPVFDYHPSGVFLTPASHTLQRTNGAEDG